MLADDFPRGNGGAGKDPVSSSIRMARGCQYYCPQGGEVVAQVPNCLAFSPRLAQPRLGRGNHKMRNLGIVVLCTALAGVRQVLLTSHRLTSRRSCIKHIRARNLHRKHRLFPREQLRYPAFKIRSEPMTVWLPPPLLSSSGQPRSLSAATNRQPLNSPR